MYLGKRGRKGEEKRGRNARLMVIEPPAYIRVVEYLKIDIAGKKRGKKREKRGGTVSFDKR